VTSDALDVPGYLPSRRRDPAGLLADTDWRALDHAMGSADDTPRMLVGLLHADQRVRSRALHHLHHVVHHQNTLYRVTVPAALYVSAILADLRGDLPVDKRPHDFPGPLLVELLRWLGSVATAAGDETAESSRRMGVPPEDYPPFVQTCEIRPMLYSAARSVSQQPRSGGT
jgi:hypothetical protein